MLGPFPKRPCDHCGHSFAPRQADQRYCRVWCREEAKSAEFRNALAAGRAATQKETPCHD